MSSNTGPPATKSLISSLGEHIAWVATSPSMFIPISILLLCLDSALSYLIIEKVPYTEIDWVAYMQQIKQIVNGERNYTEIRGSTGPLVYPAGHVHIFTQLYNYTNEGADVRLAQYIFMGVYLFTLASVLFLVYRPAKVPPYMLVFLVLSKRLHSIYMLRMFNDVFSTLFAVFAIALLQRRRWTLSAIVLSLSVSVKMNSLLYLPGAAVIYLQVLGPIAAFTQTALPFLGVQFGVAVPFLVAGFHKEYLGQAFEFSRVFFYKWTVNWRFVPEETFLSPQFAFTLLAIHVGLLVVFCSKRGYHWMALIKVPQIFSASPSGNGAEFPALVRSLLSASSVERTQRVSRVTPDYVLTTMVTSNLIGILCARSLHYQFYSWFFWTVPFALYKVHAVCGPVVALAIFATQEHAWNVYPSTSESSFCVIFSLAAMIIGIWVHDQRVGAANELQREKLELERKK